MDNVQLGPLIKAVNTLFERDIDNQLTNSEDAPGLTGTQAQLLGYLLQQSDQEIYQRDLENVFNLSRPTINGLVKRLREGGFVEVIPSQEDKRFKQVRLSPKTEAKMREHQPEFERAFIDLEAKMTRGMSTQDVRTLKTLLKSCLDNLKG
ncbi:MarR family transcriptional regulator [Lentilactobacillus parafarraginis]|jgi:DNA-binding MarR family transcriptional regulator|uniref:HTH marR-type domain-containing protein n=2 Tax=Lentilactobacillus parafarraginis TaxID=390842 RepID=A0A0R1YX23_9LACO|nr:MarR family transcriptional regulator [Lentilactobacillus parafarraginis]KRM44057.1 hypothetical protein FD47_GL001010 [Lentilactobacillus parafarraginis DSM 18390 = JCM 14109]TLQ17466.1 MarR family transcriptional regulator [Lentilactobacillus parafarraginis]